MTTPRPVAGGDVWKCYGRANPNDASDKHKAVKGDTIFQPEADPPQPCAS